MKEQPFTHEQYLTYAHNAISENKLITLQDNDSDVYIFGHSHVQWHADIGGKLLINAGSCGVPLDGNNDAAYTLLEYQYQGQTQCQEGKFTITEKRIQYDIDEVVRYIKGSNLYKEAEIWCEIIIKHLTTGYDYISSFLRYVEQTSKINGDNNKPYLNETWRSAWKSWDENKLY